MLTLTGARVVTSGGVLDAAAVTVHSGLITAVAPASSPADGEDLGGGYLVPGFIDVHCHGGAGVDFATAGPDDIRRAARLHLTHGTTGMLTSLVAGPVDDMVEQVHRLESVQDATLLGVHLEGPFLAQARCGAQNPEHLIAPSAELARKLVTSHAVRMMTLAPELPGALELIPTLREEGVLAAVGHTDATYAQTRAAFDAGAAVATHLFNGMRPIHHREPGPVLAALDAGVWCEVINDGHHVHDAVVRLVSPDALVLVTDAISAAGSAEATVELGGQVVDVADGIARVRDTGSLAGSTLTMDAAFRRAVHVAGLDLDAAVRAASTNPARLLGCSGERGDIAPGMRADLVHLDDGLHVQAVMTSGTWRHHAPDNDR